MTIEYTYNTYECELRSPSSWFNGQTTTVANNCRVIIEKIIGRMGIDPTSIQVCICCGYDENTVNETLRLAFFFSLKKKTSDTSIILTKIYHVECELLQSGENIQITGCKIYCSKPEYGKNIALRVHIEGPVDTTNEYWTIVIGYTGKYIATEELPEDKYYWKILYGWYMDYETEHNSSFVVIPPKSFFVEGEHKEFIPAKKYECIKSLEVTNIGGSNGTDDDGENDGNDDGD